MGTALLFHEKGRAAKIAVALQAEGYGVMWYPDDKPQVVMTSATQAQVKTLSSLTKGVAREWWAMASIDVASKEGGQHA